MIHFRFNDGTIDIPGEWEDKSVIALSYPSGKTESLANITITRDFVKDKNIDLAEYVDKQLVNFAKSFSKFELIKRKSIEIANHQAIQIEFHWKTPDKIIVYQKQTILFHPNKPVILTITCTSQKSNIKKFEKQFNEILQTLKLITIN